MEGGNALANRRWKSSMARAYCWPRQMSSISFSRLAWWLHWGSATLIRTAMTLNPTSRPAMANPLEVPPP